MRLARDMGTVADLYPDEIEHVGDLPHTLFSAIQMGLTFLGFEELPSEDQPPKHIWQNGEALTDWFAEVKKNRESKYGGEGEIEDPVKNDAAAALITR